MAINNIRIGEIIRIDNKEYVIFPTEHKNGFMSWEQPTLIKLEYAIKNINRKPYYKRKGFNEIPLKNMKKGFKGFKLTKGFEDDN